MLLYPFTIQMRRNVVVEIGVSVNSALEVVGVETRDGDADWTFIYELARLGFAERIGVYGLGEVFRLRKDRCRPVAFRPSEESGGIEPLDDRDE